MHAKQVAGALDLSLGPVQEMPAGGVRLPLLRIRRQDVGCVVNGIEGDRQQHQVAPEPLSAGDGLRALGDREKAEAHLRQRGSAFPELIDPLMPQDQDVLNSAVAYEDRGVQALKAADWNAAAAFRKSSTRGSAAAAR